MLLKHLALAFMLIYYQYLLFNLYFCMVLTIRSGNLHCISLETNISKLLFFLSSIISVLSNYTLCPGNHLGIEKNSCSLYFCLPIRI